MVVSLPKKLILVLLGLLVFAVLVAPKISFGQTKSPALNSIEWTTDNTKRLKLNGSGFGDIKGEVWYSAGGNTKSIALSLSDVGSWAKEFVYINSSFNDRDDSTKSYAVTPGYYLMVCADDGTTCTNWLQVPAKRGEAPAVPSNNPACPFCAGADGKRRDSEGKLMYSSCTGYKGGDFSKKACGADSQNPGWDKGYNPYCYSDCQVSYGYVGSATCGLTLSRGGFNLPNGSSIASHDKVSATVIMNGTTQVDDSLKIQWDTLGTDTMKATVDKNNNKVIYELTGKSLEVKEKKNVVVSIQGKFCSQSTYTLNVVPEHTVRVEVSDMFDTEAEARDAISKLLSDPASWGSMCGTSVGCRSYQVTNSNRDKISKEGDILMLRGPDQKVIDGRLAWKFPSSSDSKKSICIRFVSNGLNRWHVVCKRVAAAGADLPQQSPVPLTASGDPVAECQQNQAGLYCGGKCYPGYAQQPTPDCWYLCSSSGQVFQSCPGTRLPGECEAGQYSCNGSCWTTENCTSAGVSCGSSGAVCNPEPRVSTGGGGRSSGAGSGARTGGATGVGGTGGGVATPPAPVGVPEQPEAPANSGCGEADSCGGGAGGGRPNDVAAPQRNTTPSSGGACGEADSCGN